jgi:small subunit ribosomal protein S9
MTTEAAKTYLGTGRRKTSIARVRMTEGAGQIKVNDKDVDTYFTTERTRGRVTAPLKATHTLGKFDITVTVSGGGPTGQSDAVMLGIARALRQAVEGSDVTLRSGGFLTRDSREVERKKYGRRGARRGFQWAKR